MPNKRRWGAGFAEVFTRTADRISERREAAEKKERELAAKEKPVRPEPHEDYVPPPPAYAPAVGAPRDPVTAVPWGVRVAAEAGWRFLVLAGTLYVLMRVISAVRWWCWPSSRPC